MPDDLYLSRGMKEWLKLDSNWCMHFERHVLLKVKLKILDFFNALSACLELFDDFSHFFCHKAKKKEVRLHIRFECAYSQLRLPRVQF